MVDEVDLVAVATSCGGELPGKDRGPGRRTKNSRRVGIVEIDSARRKPIDVRRNRPRRRLETADPIVHIIDGNEDDIGLP